MLTACGIKAAPAALRQQGSMFFIRWTKNILGFPSLGQRQTSRMVGKAIAHRVATMGIEPENARFPR